MTTTLKKLGQSAPAATTLTDIYTVPASRKVVASVIVVANRSATPTAFRVSHALAGAADATSQYVAYHVSIGANAVVEVARGMTLATTDVIRVYNTLATLTFTVYGQEDDGTGGGGGGATFGDTPTTIHPDDAAAEGTSVNSARGDHAHAIVAAVAGASAVGDSAAEGSSTSFARADHAHSREAFAAPASLATDGSATTGTALTVTHSDHAHAIPSTLDTNARVGVRKNSTGSTFTRRRVNLIEGTNITLTVADDSGSEEVDVTIAASGSSGVSESLAIAYAIALG